MWNRDRFRRPSSKKGADPASQKGFDAEIARRGQAMLDEGRQTFRYETFGSEAFWGDALQLHKAIAGAKNGGVGPASRREPRCPSASRSMQTRCRTL